MRPAVAWEHLIKPTLADLGPPFDSPEAGLLLVAIGLQESGFTHRRQQPHGPARGFFQLEPIACKDFVLRGDQRIQAMVLEHGAALDAGLLHSALAHADGDELAVLLARDLLFRDPAPLPASGAMQEAWEYYRRCWRPGKPAWARWTGFSYRTARETCGR